MQKQFVTYEIAKSLKELGFDEKCLGYYRNPDEFFITENGRGFNYNKASWAISAPLRQQVMDWLEQFYIIEFRQVGESYWYELRDKESYGEKFTHISGTFNSKKERRVRAILKAIELCKKERVKRKD